MSVRGREPPAYKRGHPQSGNLVDYLRRGDSARVGDTEARASEPWRGLGPGLQRASPSGQDRETGKVVLLGPSSTSRLRLSFTLSVNVPPLWRCPLIGEESRAWTCDNSLKATQLGSCCTK